MERAILLVGILAIIPSPLAIAAQSEDNENITITTDKTLYALDRPILVSGNISEENLLAGERVLLTIVDANNTEFHRTFLNVSSSGAYFLELAEPGILVPGDYRAIVQYGDLSAETTFRVEHIAIDEGPINSECFVPTTCVYQLSIDNQTYEIVYAMAGKITNMTIDYERHLLSISIDVIEDSRLQIVLPREIISAVDEEGNDVEFVAMTDGVRTNSFDPVRNDTDRILAIDYKNGTRQIDIIGTAVIPEFGSNLLPLMAIAGVTVIVLRVLRTSTIQFRHL